MLLQSDRTTIHKNLCFCLLVAEILFVMGIGQTNERVLCGVIAGLLHLFFLCAFAWMFLEGKLLYKALPQFNIDTQFYNNNVKFHCRFSIVCNVNRSI